MFIQSKSFVNFSFLLLSFFLIKVFAFYRALENGEVQFFTERHIQKSSAESSDDLLPVEDIGPQEEGDVI